MCVSGGGGGRGLYDRKVSEDIPTMVTMFLWSFLEGRWTLSTMEKIHLLQ